MRNKPWFLFLVGLAAIGLGGAALAQDADDTAIADEAVATFTLEARLTPDRKEVRSLLYGWTFDRDFSAQMLESFDDNGDGRLNAGELREASQSVFNTIEEYNHFLLVERDGKEIPLHPPAQLGAAFSDDKLTVSFEARPATPLPMLGRIELGVYDPTLSIEFNDTGGLSVERPLPAGCSSQIVRPDVDAILQKDPDAFTADAQDPKGLKLMRAFAIRLVLECKAG